MTIDKIIASLLNIVLAIASALLLLISAPWTGAPPKMTPYYITVAVFWLLLIFRLLLTEWQNSRDILYKSYLGPDNKVKKKLISPNREELSKITAGLLKPRYLLSLTLLALLFLLNHLLLFAPYYLTERFPSIFKSAAGLSFSQESILLTACLICVLALAAAVLSQTREIKQNNRAFSVQNLIINAHSHASLDELNIRFDDSDQMFISMNKMEYVLQAKAIAALHQPQSQALVRMSLAVKLGGDIPITEFYIKRMSLFVADVVIECENFRQEYYPLFAVNNIYMLNFYILCKEVAAKKLIEKFYLSAGLRIYFSIIMKNSVGVITELYGTALYGKARHEGGKLHYLLQESRDNQYFYM